MDNISLVWRPSSSFVYTYPTIQLEVVVLIPIGVVLFKRVLIVLLRRNDEFGCWIPQLGVFGVGQENPSQSLSDAEVYVEMMSKV